MSTLRERIDGLVSQWRAATKAISAEGHERPLEWEGKDILRLCADELALAAEGPGDETSASVALEHDRTKVAECVTAIKATLQNYSWLMDGRGSYEWDDDRYRLEFKTATEQLREDLEPLVRIAADWSNCPKTWEEVQAARAAAPSLHKEGLPANAELLLCIRSLLPIAHLSCQDDDLKPSLEECTDGACAHAKDLLKRAALHKEGAGGDWDAESWPGIQCLSFASPQDAKRAEKLFNAMTDEIERLRASPAGRAEQEQK